MRTSVSALLVVVAAASAGAQSPRTHRLEATPATVAYGYYWSEAKPVLRIASGDIIDVDTLLTSTPDRLEKSGVQARGCQASLRAIVEQVKDRGPGGHILTGPVFVEGAEPGDALEVKVLSIDLPIAYGYNGCSGFIRENCEPGACHDHHPARSQAHDRGLHARHRDSAEAVLRQHGRGAAARCRTRQQQSAGHSCRQPRQQGAGRRHHAVDSRARAGRAVRDRRRSCRAG